MYNILVNWEDLKTYFISAQILEMKFEAKLKARMIKKMLLNRKNHIYFHFETPIVQEYEKLDFFKKVTQISKICTMRYIYILGFLTVGFMTKLIMLTLILARSLSECNDFL